MTENVINIYLELIEKWMIENNKWTFSNYDCHLYEKTPIIPTEFNNIMNWIWQKSNLVTDKPIKSSYREYKYWRFYWIDDYAPVQKIELLKSKKREEKIEEILK